MPPVDPVTAATELLLRCLGEEPRVISSLAAPDIRPVDDSARAAWRQRRTDRHPGVEILFALSGRARYGFNGLVYPMDAGAWMVITGDDWHDNGYPPDAPAVLHGWLNCHPDQIVWRLLAVEKGAWNGIGEHHVIDDPDFAGWLWREIGHCKVSPAPERIRRRHLGGMLACLAARMTEATLEGRVLHAGERRDRLVRLVERRIHETHGLGVTAASAARLAGYSPYHFMRLFKSATGRTLKEYVAEVRYAHCRRQLAKGVAKKVIAADLGFSSPAAFSHWFNQRRR